ncbi:MAG: hypothetical protein IJW79_04090 [Clostridia bacterium]|nr:hypothetical protein [Clostridia bacterium]
MNRDIPQYSNIGYTGTGYLVIRASAASSAIPLEGAVVTVRGNQPNFSSVIVKLTTERNGLTPKISLATPPRGNSTSPGIENPFATYNVDVQLDGFFPTSAQQVPIFDGITSIQPINLIPLPKNGYTDRFAPYDEKVTDSEPPNL